MATGQVKEMYQRNPVPVIVLGRHSKPQWSEVFQNNPKIVPRVAGRRVQVLQNGPGMRPYIVSRTDKTWFWRTGAVKQPGEMFFSREEKDFAERFAGCVLIEPATKVAGSNKAWIAERWQQVVNASPGVRFLQVGPSDSQWLDGVGRVPTTFRQAAAVLSVSKVFIGTEGALHHAAAAFNVPAVVLYSEFISPAVTGYAYQHSIRHAGDPCGARYPCQGCRQSMDRITVDEVLHHLALTLQESGGTPQ